MKFEENWPRGEEGVDDRRMDGRWQVITIAHPKPSVQMSYKDGYLEY